MNKTSNIQKPKLSRNTFWDTRLETLDFDRYANFTIIRVFERGLSHEIREVIRYFGKDKIIQTLTSADQLMSRAFIISKRLFHLSNDAYKCFGKKQQAMNYSRY
jgi:hypothetical protein